MNKELVQGDLIANALPEKTWDDNLAAGFAAGYASSKLLMQQAKAKKDAINAKVAGYIDALDTNVDITELTPTQQKSITNYLVNQRSEYADAASRIAKIEDPTSPQYMELRAKINGISQSFQNLATQVKSYKEDKASYLKDFDNSLISDGNELNTLNESAKLYTDEAALGVGEGGGLVFWNEGNESYDSYNQIPKPFLKDFDTANKLLEINKNVYSAGQSLTGARKNMVRQQLNNILAKGGRKSLLSLASDDFIIEGGLGLEDPELFAPGNDDALKEAVLNSYMNVLEDSASQGARDKRPSSGRGSGGFSGALKDELNVSGPVVNKAMQFSTYSMNVPPEQREAKTSELLNVINSINPTSRETYVSRGQYYNMYLNGMDIDDSEESRNNFNKSYGGGQVFLIKNPSKPQEAVSYNINTDDPYQLYEFYLKNTGLSSKAQNYYLGQYDNFSNQIKESNSKKKTNTKENTGNFG